METKRLVIDAPIALHDEIKKRAAFKHQTMRVWALRAIIEQIRREKMTE